MINEKLKILIIEDEDALLDVLQLKLTKDGYLVEVATNGAEGYEKIIDFEPDMILLDIVMPKMDGYEVLEKMKKNKIYIPVIIISNSGQPIEIEKTTKLGAIDHLIKTEFSPLDVVSLINKHIKIINQKKVILKNDVDGFDMTKIAKREDKNVKSRNVTILLVEDDSFLREISSKKLVKEGFVVYEVIDGENALNVINNIVPDLVLLDIILPSLNGFQVLDRIRKNKDSKIAKVPVVMLSNLGQDEYKKKAKKLGANDYFVKANFSTDEIVKKILKMLEK